MRTLSTICFSAASTVLAATLSLQAATVRYVNVNSTNPVPPFTDWATAATNIQDAVDATVAGDEIVVTNGVYATGGRAVFGTMTNRVAVTKSVTVRSVNGPDFTIIEGWQVPGTTNGDGAIRCVYLANGAALGGFTLTHGATRGWLGDSVREGRGGGAWCESVSAVVSNCVIIGNVAKDGGGVYQGTINGCAVVGNYANEFGGGTHRANLNNCTVTGNYAKYGGGAQNAGVANCIVYLNQATIDGDNLRIFSANYTCTTPLPTSGTGNFTNNPGLATQWRLGAGSPCIGGGLSAPGSDLDGEPWDSPPSIGCDEYHVGALTGPLSVEISAAYSNIAAGYEMEFSALIAGRPTASAWFFGDGTVLSNQAYASHAWTTPGDYPVVLRAYNESQPAGISATAMVHVVTPPVHFVAVDGLNPAPPFASWATAATDVQAAVDEAVPGALILVSNGVYSAGARAVDGTTTNRLVVGKPLTVRSVNGPQFTAIQGYQIPGSTNGDAAIRCARLARGVTLSGFTFTNGATRTSGEPYLDMRGGALWCESPATVISNCVFAGNSGYDAGAVYNGTLNNCSFVTNNAQRDGGATFASRLNNCRLVGNSAVRGGGGAIGGTLINCTLVGNATGQEGGGAYNAILNNCIVYYNSASNSPNYYLATINNSCSTPLPAGAGNLDSSPVFVNTNSWSDLHLRSNSPCINAGNNAYVPPGSADLDGNPRVVNGTVDIGAYEWQVPVRLAALAPPGPGGLPLTLTGETNRVYALHASSNLTAWSWLAWLTNAPGQSTYTDPLAPLPPARFYKAVPVP